MCADEEVWRQMANRWTMRTLALGCALALVASASAQTPASSSRGTAVLELSPDFPTSRHPDLLMSEGHALYDAGHYKEAAASFEQAMQLGVSRPHVAAKKVAQSYARLGNRKQARRWAEIAALLERNPEGLKWPLQNLLLLKI